MPPTSNIRKSSFVTMQPNEANPLANSSRHTVSGRAIRTNTTRPTNYYARPFASKAAADPDEAHDASPPGFFPALQFFSDAITALPKECMRQFTLRKEVEAKIHGPSEKMEELIDALMDMPVPPRKGVIGNPGAAAGQQGLLSLTAANSAMGSANVSVVNGGAPNTALANYDGQASLPGSTNGEEVVQQDSEEELVRRQQYAELRMLMRSMLPNLDEKNVVLAESNRVLDLQLLRVDSVMPHVESELSEDARLGSMTHWAYSDNRQKKQALGPAAHRRDVAATNNLAAAASAVHETEIAQARREAGREATRDKQRGRAKEHADSDFDDKPKKAQPKVAKSKALAQTVTAGLGAVTNGEAVKRRKVDKMLIPPAMERTLSAATKGTKAMRETPRSTPAAEPIKRVVKTAKPAPPPKKKLPGSTHASPMLASSPLHSSFNVATAMEPPLNARPQSSRIRQNSSTTNLRHEKLVDGQNSRPVSAAGLLNGNGNKRSAKRKAPDDAQDQANPAEDELATKTTEREGMQHEDGDIPPPPPTARIDVEQRPPLSRSASHSGKAGRGSKTGTPRTEAFPPDNPLARTRSTRSLRNGGHDSSSSEPQQQGVGSKHKRHASNSHLVKQLAPFNRSPDLDRHRTGSDVDEDMDSLDDGRDGSLGENGAGTGGAEERRSLRRSRSRRDTGVVGGVVHGADGNAAAPLVTASSPIAASGEAAAPGSEVDGLGEDDAMPDAPLPAEEPPAAADSPSTLPDAVNEAQVEEELDEEDTLASLPPSSPADTVPSLAADEPPNPILATTASNTEMDMEEPADASSSDHDPDSPSEPKYCYCNRGSYGEMVACDNDGCAREWFHLGCTELEVAPGEKEVWYCRDCEKLRRGAGRGGRGKGKGR